MNAQVIDKPLDVNRLFPHSGPNRGVGRTTVLALEAIALSIKYPNAWHVVKDHHGTAHTDRMLLKVIQETVTRLGLKFFRYSTNEGVFQVRCDRLA